MNLTPSTIRDFFDQQPNRLSPKAIDLLIPHVSLLELPKKHLLIKEGTKSDYVYLILKGGARSYHHQGGLEVHTWFAFENEVIGSLRNFHGLTSRETIALLEDSQLLSFRLSGIKPLMSKHPELTRYLYGVIEEHALYLEDRLYHTHLRSAAERYQMLLDQEPMIFQRVPLTYIASYLGISRETLSRLRSK